MPSLPYGRGSRFDPKDGASGRGESIAVRAQVARELGGVASSGVSQIGTVTITTAGTPAPTDGSVAVFPLFFAARNMVLSRFIINYGHSGRTASVGLYGALNAQSRVLTLIEASNLVVTSLSASGAATINMQIAPIRINAGTLIFAGFTQDTALGGPSTSARVNFFSNTFPGRSVVGPTGGVLPKEIGPVGSVGVTAAVTLSQFPIFGYSSEEFGA